MDNRALDHDVRNMQVTGFMRLERHVKRRMRRATARNQHLSEKTATRSKTMLAKRVLAHQHPTLFQGCG
eukprot:2836404-Rhodomonas_salina.1